MRSSGKRERHYKNKKTSGRKKKWKKEKKREKLELNK